MSAGLVIGWLRRRQNPVLAFLIVMLAYAALAVVLIDHGAPLDRDILGFSSDPYAIIWCLGWWPFAILHHIDPLHARVIWQPEGLNLAWVTAVPLLAFLAAPLTLGLGPVTAYNVLTLAAPMLAAASAYACCLYVTRRPGAAFLGGLGFGFSTYEMAECQAHLNLDFNAAIPLLLLVVLLRLDRRLSRPIASGLFALLLATEFYISIEIAATCLFFGVAVWVLALMLLPGRRGALLRLIADGVLAGLLTALLISPYLIEMLRTPRDVVIPAGWALVTSAHLFNLFVTTPKIVFYLPSMTGHGIGAFGWLPQYDFTTGLPMILIIGFYLHKVFRTAYGRLLTFALALILIASLGPQLWIGDWFSGIAMPWDAMLELPLLSSALPGRFCLYSSLLIAVIIALWTADAPTVKAYHWRMVLALLAWAVTVAPPNPVQAAPFANFFQSGRLEAVLGPARVLILPRRDGDASTFWQAENHFGFVQTGGFLGFPPKPALRYDALRDIAFNLHDSNFSAQIEVLCKSAHTNDVLAGPGTNTDFLEQMAKLGWPHRMVDDVEIFRVPDQIDSSR